jgi:PIN domain nuclease of toxin-antitoxin system
LRVLLDSHTLLWWILNDPALSDTARELIAERNDSIVVSAASAWELAIKFRLGKLPGAADLISGFSTAVEEEGFQLLSVSADHGIRAGLLPGRHKDPFDRMLIAQSQAENMPIISNDVVFESYGIRRLW